MYRNEFGTKQQIEFDSESEYYEFLGYLAKSDGSTNLVWERNDESGAWGPEGRIEFNQASPSSLGANLLHTAGRDSIVSRVNCNEFVTHIVDQHSFEYGSTQDRDVIKSTIPTEYHPDFDRGFNL